MPPVPSSVIEAAEVLRSELLRAEGALRVLSQDTGELAPIFAARLNAAAHLVHNAVSALPPDGRIGAM
jgi:hypothetical protein